MAPRPAGFPNCGVCPYADGRRPEVCLACFDSAACPESAICHDSATCPDGAAAGAGRCGCCDRPGVAGRPCPNPLCARADRGWSVAYAVGAHAGGLRDAVCAYKYRAQRRWAPVFAALLAGLLVTRATWFEEFDLLVPVPAYLGPGARRSWDPVGEVAAVLGGRLGPGWDSAPGAVVKTSETASLQGRRRRQRQQVAEGELRRALHVPDPGRVAGRRILVVDDVLTGGTTLREMAGALRRAGAAEVGGLVLARRGGPLGCRPQPGAVWIG